MPTLRKILYIEDDPDIQTIARLALENVGGFRLEVCNSGQLALDIAEAFAPDLILSDVMMADMDGPDTIAKLREIPSLSNTPVIFMTAKVQTSEIQELMSYGALGVISKPFDPMTLSSEIQNLWKNQ